MLWLALPGITAKKGNLSELAKNYGYITLNSYEKSFVPITKNSSGEIHLSTHWKDKDHHMYTPLF